MRWSNSLWSTLVLSLVVGFTTVFSNEAKAQQLPPTVTCDQADLQCRVIDGELRDESQDISIKALEETRNNLKASVDGLRTELGNLRGAKARLDRIEAWKAAAQKSLDGVASKEDVTRAADEIGRSLRGDWEGALKKVEDKLADRINALVTVAKDHEARIKTIEAKPSINLRPFAFAAYNSVAKWISLFGGELDIPLGSSGEWMLGIGGGAGLLMSKEDGFSWGASAIVTYTAVPYLTVGIGLNYLNVDEIGSPGVKAFAFNAGPELGFEINGFHLDITGGAGGGAKTNDDNKKVDAFSWFVGLTVGYDLF